MDDMEEKLGNILSNPEAMQKIMALAQSLNQTEGQSASEPPAPPPPKEAMAPARPSAPSALPPGFDLSMLQKLSSLSGRSSIDKNQRTLLNALAPYLSRQRISKLERAMQAARMAQLASSMLGSQFPSGR